MQTFDATDIKYVYSPDHEAIGTVAAGETFAVETVDCFTGRYDDPASFEPETVAWVEENLDGVTGPIAVAGAEPGGAVEVTLEGLAITTRGTLAVSRCEALSPADWWHEEDHVVNLEIADGMIELGEGWSVPVRPLIGCLATAPGRETVLSRHEGPYGGNLDCSEITAGATVILPVEVPGAHLYFGDCKAAMGAGEIVACPEVGMRIEASARPTPRPASMRGPRVRTESRLTTIASDISLADAARAAFRDLKEWLEDEWRLEPERATVLMGIGADCAIAQVSNRLHTAKCSIDLELLPPELR